MPDMENTDGIVGSIAINIDEAEKDSVSAVKVLTDFSVEDVGLRGDTTAFWKLGE